MVESILSALLSGVTAAAGGSAIYEALRSLYRSRQERREVETLQQEVDALEERAEKKQPLGEFVEAILSAASERQRLAVLRSERRASNLFRVATMLMTLSVFVPFLLIAIYYQLDPSQELARLIASGIKPDVAVQLAKRDWHLLVAGVSFGLLFLAAAKGISAVESRQRELYFHELRVTNYYGDLARALKIAVKLDEDTRPAGADPVSTETVRKIIALLMDKGSYTTDTEDVSDKKKPKDDDGVGENELLKTIAEALKQK